MMAQRYPIHVQQPMSLPSPDDGATPLQLRSHWHASVAPLVQHLAAAAAGEWLVWWLYQARDDDERLILFFFAGMAVLVGNGAALWYRVAMLRSRVLSADSAGIVMVQGLLPWKKMRQRLGWPEVAEVRRRAGAGLWPFATDTLIVKGRAADAQPLVMPGVREGERGVAALEGLWRAGSTR